MGNTTKAKYRTVMFDLLVIYLRLVSQSSAYISTIYCERRSFSFAKGIKIVQSKGQNLKNWEFWNPRISPVIILIKHDILWGNVANPVCILESPIPNSSLSGLNGFSGDIDSCSSSSERNSYYKCCSGVQERMKTIPPSKLPKTWRTSYT